MKVVLLENVDNLGIAGDIKEVADGFARNYLLPQNLAVKVGDAKAKALLKNISQKREQTKKQIEEIKKVAKKFEGKTIEIKSKANDKGVLFKAVSSSEVAKKLGIDAKKLSFEPIKTAGEHQVDIDFGNNIKIKIIIKILKK